MKCKYCEAELEEGSTLCPVCGIDNGECPAPAEAAEAEAASAEAAETGATPAEPAVEENASAAEETKTPAEENKAPEMKKGVTLTPGKLALGIVAVVLLTAVLVALVLQGMGVDLNPTRETVDEFETLPTDSLETLPLETAAPATVPADGNPDDVTCKGTYTVSDDEVIAARETVVATVGDAQLTNGELQIYYWLQVQQFLSSYSSYAAYMGLDYTQPLDTQICSLSEEGVTWQQFFLDAALSDWHSYQSLANESLEAGFVLEGEYRDLIDSLPETLATDGGLQGFASAEDFLSYNVGKGGTIEDYVTYMEVYYQGFLYFNDQYETFTPTQEEMDAYFTENEAVYAESGLTRDTKYVDVRHILVLPEGATVETIYTETFSDEAWAVGEQNAQTILDQWLAGEATEDSFAALANEKSQDPGSNTNGGLYEGVAVGDMVEQFEAWCFDEARQVGDYGIVKTDLGYHIMFFSGSTPAWPSQVENDILSEKADALLLAVTDKYPLEVDYSKIALGYVNMAY